MNMAWVRSLLRKLDTVPPVSPSVTKRREHLQTLPGEVPDPGYFFDPKQDYLGEHYEGIKGVARNTNDSSRTDLPSES